MAEDASGGGPATPPPAPPPPGSSSWPPAPPPPPPPPPSWGPPPLPPGTTPPPAGWTVAGPVPPGYPGATTTNGLAVASLVLGCASFAFCFVPAILALVFGYVSRRQIDESHGTQTGRGLAVAGIVLGWVGVGLGVLLVILIVIGLLADPNPTVHTHNGIETLRVLVPVPASV